MVSKREESASEGAGAGCVSLRLQPASHELRRLALAVEAFAAAEALAPRVANALALALEEAVTNVLFYGFETEGAGSVDIGVTLERRENVVRVTVRDNGRPFDPTARELAPMPTSLDDITPGGLGLRIIRKVAKRIEYRREQGFNHLELELAL